MRRMLVGIFVGGRGERMGSVPKGLLAAPSGSEALAPRLARICREALPTAEIVLVGDAAAYAALDIPTLADEPPGIGPLGGLVALLAEAEARDCDALAIATDLPHVTTDMVVQIATHAPNAAAVAPRMDGKWQPLFARYAPEPCLPVARGLVAEGRRAAHGVLDAFGDHAAELPLEDATRRLLDDWDTPEDIARL